MNSDERNPHARTISNTIKLSLVEDQTASAAAKTVGLPKATFLRNIVVRQLEKNEAIESPSDERIMLAEVVATIIAALSDRYDEKEAVEIATKLFLKKRSIKP